MCLSTSLRPCISLLFVICILSNIIVHLTLCYLSSLKYIQLILLFPMGSGFLGKDVNVDPMAPTMTVLWLDLSRRGQGMLLNIVERLDSDSAVEFEAYLEAFDGHVFEDLLDVLGNASTTQFQMYISVLIGKYDLDLGSEAPEAVDVLEASLDKLKIQPDYIPPSLEDINNQLDDLVSQVSNIALTGLKQAKDSAFTRKGVKFPSQPSFTNAGCDSDQAILNSLDRDFQWTVPSGEATKFFEHMHRQPTMKPIYLSFSVRDIPTAWHLADLAVLTLHLEDRPEPVTRLDILNRFRQQCHDFTNAILEPWRCKFLVIANLELEELQLNFSEALAPDGTYLGEDLAKMLTPFTYKQPKYFAIIALTDASEHCIRNDFKKREQGKWEHNGYT